MKKFSCRQRTNLVAADTIGTPAGAGAERTKDGVLEGLRRDSAVEALTQVCPVCGRIVQPDDSSEMLLAVQCRDVSVERGRDAILVAHVRHEHTDYEERLEMEDEDWDAEDFDPNEKRAEIKYEANLEARDLIDERRERAVEETAARLEAVARNSQAEGRLMAEAALAHFRKHSGKMDASDAGNLKRALRKRRDDAFLKGVISVLAGFGVAGLTVGKKKRGRK